jgi:3-isopropylmalate/(R)-2-methylmalate dehydratase large subunit
LLPGDPEARFDREAHLDAAEIEPMVTWGTSPESAAPISGVVPDPAMAPDPSSRDAMTRALDYMGLTPGKPLSQIAVSRVFIGSCTNSRIEDLRAAAGLRRSPGCACRPWCAGSGLVKAQAEGGASIHLPARRLRMAQPGCSMCVGMNGDLVAPGDRCASTSIETSSAARERRPHAPGEPGDGRCRRCNGQAQRRAAAPGGV